MTTASEASLQVAGSYLGLKEYPGASHNPKVVKFFADTGNSWVKDDETPWCAAFVGAVLAQCGLPHTGKLNARSYLDWGYKVDEKRAEPGDVVVFWRGSPSSWQGHVGFFVRWQGDDIVVRGGNQGNAVTDDVYLSSRLLGFRRAYKPKTSIVQSTTLQSAAAGAVAAVTGTTTVATQTTGDVQTAAIIAGVVIFLAFLWIMKERVKKFKNGAR